MKASASSYIRANMKLVYPLQGTTILYRTFENTLWASCIGCKNTHSQKEDMSIYFAFCLQSLFRPSYKEMEPSQAQKLLQN